MIVCDTNVLSEPMRGDGANPAVVAWLDRQPRGGLYLPAIVLAEIYAGLDVAPAGKRADALRTELSHLLSGLFRGRVLEFDKDAAEAFGAITASSRAQGKPMSFADAAIAATALSRGFAVATHDINDFAPAGVTVVNPWTD